MDEEAAAEDARGPRGLPFGLTDPPRGPLEGTTRDDLADHVGRRRLWRVVTEARCLALRGLSGRLLDQVPPSVDDLVAREIRVEAIEAGDHRAHDAQRAVLHGHGHAGRPDRDVAMRLVEALGRRVEQGLFLARPELGVAIGLRVEEAHLLV